MKQSRGARKIASIIAAAAFSLVPAIACQTLEPLIMTPEQFAKRLKSDYDKYEKVVKATGAKID